MEKRITYWTKERCMGEAKKYTRGAEWRKKDNNSYSAAYRNGWIDECIAHMESDRVSSDYWTKERCHEEALKHNTKSSFKDSRPSTPYNKARKNGWLDEICSHMEETRKPAGYWHIKENVLEEARKHKTRSEWHKSSSISFSNSKKYGWYDECVAHMEEVDRHTPNHWTKERCLEEARKHKVKSHWIESAHSSYQAAKRYGWFDECTEHMEEADRFKPIYWTKERCLEEASKYSSRNEWFKSSGSSYQSAKKYTWFDECVAHMEDKYKPMGFWNDKENVLAEARKYKTKGEWVKNSAPSYQAANKHEWFDECVAHMVSTRKPDGYWHIKENVLAEARKHKTRGAWHKSSSISFTMSKKYGWYDECVAHMGEKLHKPEGYWNDKENVLAEARKYKTNQEWKEKGGASQNFAYKHGWFEECVAHMKKK
jgi:hypothetical protein